MQTKGKYLRWSMIDETTMSVSNVSNYSGKTHTIQISATPQQFTTWSCGALIQEAFPDLTPDEREFIISGITKEEWEELFGE